MPGISVDLRVENEKEATALMIHHLIIACAYFECTPSDRGLFANKEIRTKMSDIWADAASSFVAVLYADYESMD